jgi:hypothetical protein
MLGLQAPEAPFELVAIPEGADVIGRRRLSSDELDLPGKSTTVSPLVVAGVDDQPVQPRVPTLWVAQTRKLSPGVLEGFLDGVFREVRIPEDQPGNGVEAVGGSGREDLEGLVVAASCRLDEIALHRSLRLPARPK